MKNIHIIIVTYNAMTWLKHCLDSCTNYNIIVVDNASSDETVKFIFENYPKVTVLPQKENLGFGKANNIGISYALKQFSSDYVFLLNQDAYLVDNVIDDLIEIHVKNTNYGILSPIHITGDKKRLDKNFGQYLAYDKKETMTLDEVSKNEAKTIFDVPFVNAAGWLISKECLLSVGGFDPIFFLYGEDDNLCQRILYHGYNIAVVFNTYMIHDRDHRREESIDFTSQKYLKIQANIYKTKYADVNDPDAIEGLNKKIKYLKRQCFKKILSFSFKEFKIEYAKHQLLIKSRKGIELSYRTNKTKASHYLSI